MKKNLKLILGIGVLLGCIVVLRIYGIEQQLIVFREWVAQQGALGPFIYAAAYALATVLALPGSLLTIAAGVIFGSMTGIATVMSGATIGAGLCFLIARYLARDTILAIFEKNEKFQKLDAITEKNGAIIVAITRLVPLFPFNLLNYGFGLTKVPFLTYMIWTFICMLPGSVLYIVGTDALTKSISEGEIPWLLVGIVLIVLVLLTLIVRKAKDKLKE